MTGLFFLKEVVFLLGVMLIIAYVVVIEIAAICLNHFIVKSSDMNGNTYMFTVRYNGFSFFTSIIICGSLIAFIYLIISRSGFHDSRSITAIIILVMELIELVRKLFFKVEVDNTIINFQSITRRTSFAFNDINKVETIKLGLAIAEAYVDDKKMFTLNSTMVGYRLFIERLENEGK